MEKVILTTGGTGGHIFPALAVAEELRKRYPKIELLFIGSLYGPEKRLAEKNGLAFEGLNVRGFLGRGFRAVPAALNMMKSIWQARKLIKKFNPDVVGGFGGYASFAPVVAAWLGKKPIIIHEQNAIAGAGNRFLSRLADKICVSIPGTKGLGAKALISGNPVRAVFGEVYHKRLDKKGKGKNLFILGGSQGAHALNKFIIENLSTFVREGINLRHQTGEKDLHLAREAYIHANLDPGQAFAFIDDMAEAYEWADLILCRAGASTIAEICACALPTIFVPLPIAIYDHQTKNARALEKAEAALLIPEAELKEDNTIRIILDLLNDQEKLQSMGKAAYKLAKPDAAGILVDCMEEIAKKAKSHKNHE